MTAAFSLPWAFKMNDGAVPSTVRELVDRKGYKILKKIGSGTSADIYVVLSNRYNDHFILKYVHLDRMTVCQQCELNVLKALNSVHVIRLYDFEVSPQNVALFLEYCPAGSLHDHIRQYGPLGGPKLIGVLKTLLSGLNFIHTRRISHGDIKPQNILIDRHGRLKYADFGLSRAILFQGKSTLRTGSLGYAAPELFEQAPFDAFAADLWALGVTIYFITTGRIPWPCGTIEEYAGALQRRELEYPPEMPDFIRDMISKLVAWVPQQRISCAILLDSPLFTGVSDKDGILLSQQRTFTSLRKGPQTKTAYMTLKSIAQVGRKRLNGSHHNICETFQLRKPRTSMSETDLRDLDQRV